MPKIALRDAPSWRRRLAEYGLTLDWLAARTGKSRATVKSYSSGLRRPPAAWLADAESALDAFERSAA